MRRPKLLIPTFLAILSLAPLPAKDKPLEDEFEWHPERAPEGVVSENSNGYAAWRW